VELSVDLQFKIYLDKITDFSNIAKQISEHGLNKKAFKMAVEKIDEVKTCEKAGVKYIPKNEFRIERAGNTPFSVLTDFGRIDLNLNKIQNGSSYETVLRGFTENGHSQLSEPFKNKIRKVILETTYRRSTNITNLYVGLGFNKDAIWDVVMEKGISVSETYKVEPTLYDLILIDGLNSVTGKMFPLHHSVGIPFFTIKEELAENRLLNKSHIIVVGGEPGLHHQLREHKIQMCAFHFEQSICYKLWQDEMSFEDRKNVNKKIKQILNTLKNSVIKNVGACKSRIKKRITKTKNDLENIAIDLLNKEFNRAAKFIMFHLDTVTLFAGEAVNLVIVPWTNNIMERFIGEIGFRIKNRWAHWSRNGLNSIIFLIMRRYCSRNVVKMEF